MPPRLTEPREATSSVLRPASCVLRNSKHAGRRTQDAAGSGARRRRFVWTSVGPPGQKVSVTAPVTFRGIGTVANVKPRTSVLCAPALVSGSQPVYFVHVFRLRPASVSVAPLARTRRARLGDSV